MYFIWRLSIKDAWFSTIFTNWILVWISKFKFIISKFFRLKNNSTEFPFKKIMIILKRKIDYKLPFSMIEHISCKRISVIIEFSFFTFKHSILKRKKFKPNARNSFFNIIQNFSFDCLTLFLYLEKRKILN